MKLLPKLKYLEFLFFFKINRFFYSNNPPSTAKHPIQFNHTLIYGKRKERINFLPLRANMPI